MHINSEVNAFAEKRYRSREKRLIWYRVLSVLMCVTVFFTTYALILPALTFDADTAATRSSDQSQCSNGIVFMNPPETDYFYDMMSPVNFHEDTTQGEGYNLEIYIKKSDLGTPQNRRRWIQFLRRQYASSERIYRNDLTR